LTPLAVPTPAPMPKMAAVTVVTTGSSATGRATTADEVPGDDKAANGGRDGDGEGDEAHMFL
jgi:hypothetical protein